MSTHKIMLEFEVTKEEGRFSGPYFDTSLLSMQLDGNDETDHELKSLAEMFCGLYVGKKKIESDNETKIANAS